MHRNMTTEVSSAYSDYGEFVRIYHALDLRLFRTKQALCVGLTGLLFSYR